MIYFSEKGFIQYKGRLKDMDGKCEKDMILNEVEESGFGSSNLDVMKLAFDRLNDPVTRMRFSAVCGFWRWGCTMLLHYDTSPIPMVNALCL